MPKTLILSYFLQKMNFLGHIDHAILKPLLCLKFLPNFRTKYWTLGKSLEPFFCKVQKTAKRGKKGRKGPTRVKKGDFSKISNFYERKGHATFEPLWMPNFMPCFRKILFFRIAVWTNGQTDGRMDKTDSIGPSSFHMETNNLKIIEISHRTQIKYIYIFWCRLSSLLSSNFMQNLCQKL